VAVIPEVSVSYFDAGSQFNNEYFYNTGIYRNQNGDIYYSSEGRALYTYDESTNRWAPIEALQQLPSEEECLTSYSTYNKSKPFIQVPQDAILVYPNYDKINIIIDEVSPNDSKNFWSKPTLFTINFRTQELKLSPDLTYPKSLRIDGTYLVCKSDDILVPFWKGHFKEELLQAFTEYESRGLVCNFQPCPSDTAEEMLFASGILKKEKPVDPIKLVRQAMRKGG
jgi:hypothetical protein